MNFENYNKIYKEILDDEDGELSANYLLNKYEMKHEEELLNILNQIKKNEYISSDNKVISKLINELDEDVNLLDINEIINIKEKVINTRELDLLEDEINEEQTIETSEIIEDKTQNSQKIITRTNKKSKKYLIYSIPIIALVSTAFLLNNPSSSDEKKDIKQLEIVENKKIEKIIHTATVDTKPDIVKAAKKEIIKETEVKKENIHLETKLDKTNLIKKVELLVVKKEKIGIKDTKKSNLIEEVVESTSNSEDTLNKIDNKVTFNNTDTNIVKNNIKLSSLKDITKYIKKLKVEKDKLLFEGNYYSENSDLFGFKIFKITPLYVKFEDTSKNIRKRFLLNK